MNVLKIEIPSNAPPRLQHLNGKLAQLVRFDPAQVDLGQRDSSGLIEWQNGHTALVYVDDRLFTVDASWCRIIPEPEAANAAPSE